MLLKPGKLEQKPDNDFQTSQQSSTLSHTNLNLEQFLK